jgi:tRNA modification GTPase
MTIDLDTISAIATPPGVGALAIVRLSGPKAIAIAASCCRRMDRIRNVKGMSLVVTTLLSKDSVAIDQVVVAIYRSPHSYTGEDMVEITCHGGHAVPRQILARLVESGARIAEPGEFTRRAFLNGKMDLSQAEAVAELIQSGTERASRAAAKRLEGGLSISVRMIRGELIELLADIEARLDFVDDEIDPLTKGELAERLESVRKKIVSYMETFRQGKMLQQGAVVVLAGAPNAGKSTLFNHLIQRDRMLVSPVPGTTRDAVEEWVDLEGIPVKLVDTAGIRTGGGKIEQEGIKKTVERIRVADLVVLLVDGQKPRVPHPEIVEVLRSTKLIPVWSKSDKLRKGEYPVKLPGPPKLSISARTGERINHLKSLIINNIYGIEYRESDEVIIAEERQYSALRDSNDALNRLVEAEQRNQGLEIMAMELREAVSALGRITGEEIGDEVLDRIFSKFCIGK